MLSGAFHGSSMCVSISTMYEIVVCAFHCNDDDIDDIPFKTGNRMITISNLSSVNGIKCFTRIGRIAIVAQSRHIFSFH